MYEYELGHFIRAGHNVTAVLRTGVGTWASPYLWRRAGRGAAKFFFTGNGPINIMTMVC